MTIKTKKIAMLEWCSSSADPLWGSTASNEGVVDVVAPDVSLVTSVSLVDSTWDL